VGEAANPALALRDLRRARHHRHRDEVDWVEAAGNYCRLHVGKQAHLLRETMAALEGRLDPKQFVRIHRSTMWAAPVVFATVALSVPIGMTPAWHAFAALLNRIIGSQM